MIESKRLLYFHRETFFVAMIGKKRDYKSIARKFVVPFFCFKALFVAMIGKKGTTNR